MLMSWAPANFLLVSETGFSYWVVRFTWLGVEGGGREWGKRGGGREIGA